MAATRMDWTRPRNQAAGFTVRPGSQLAANNMPYRQMPDLKRFLLPTVEFDPDCDAITPLSAAMTVGVAQ